MTIEAGREQRWNDVGDVTDWDGSTSINEKMETQPGVPPFTRRVQTSTHTELAFFSTRAHVLCTLLLCCCQLFSATLNAHEMDETKAISC